MRGLVATTGVGRGLVVVPPRLHVPGPARPGRGAGRAVAPPVGRVRSAAGEG
jgi:hypothetical protein